MTPAEIQRIVRLVVHSCSTGIFYSLFQDPKSKFSTGTQGGQKVQCSMAFVGIATTVSSSSWLPKSALYATAAAVFAGASGMLVSAWTISSPNNRISSSPTTAQPQHRTTIQSNALNSAVRRWRHRIPVVLSTTGTPTTLCEASRRNQDDAEPAGTATTTPPLPVRQGTSYVQMKLPDRAKAATHAIYGALLQHNLIEQYDVYRVVELPPSVSQQPPEDSHDSASTFQDGQDIVTAVVKLAYGLDGHHGVVHGGILALIIDDVLGIGNFALSTMPTNGGTSTSSSDDARPAAIVEYAVTANLNVNYTAPVPSGSTVLVTATLVQPSLPPHPRKLHWVVSVTSLDESVTYCRASSLYIIPRTT
jgi:acyl-coenzyme A thioesterase PaaI-like protein